jgi:hypothetical protein
VKGTRRPKKVQAPIVPEEQATAPAIESFDGNNARETFTATGEVSWPTRLIPLTQVSPDVVC